MKVEFLINFDVLLNTKYSQYHLLLEVTLPLEIYSKITNVRNTSCSTLDKWFLHFILRELKLFAK